MFRKLATITAAGALSIAGLALSGGCDMNNGRSGSTSDWDNAKTAGSSQAPGHYNEDRTNNYSNSNSERTNSRGNSIGDMPGGTQTDSSPNSGNSGKRHSGGSSGGTSGPGNTND